MRHRASSSSPLDCRAHPNRFSPIEQWPCIRRVDHLKSPGYTEIRLLTRAGVDLGRLVPNQTQERYLDWK
jgi:hypothetical protein